MIAVAENMASTPVVRDRYGDPFAARVLAPEVDRAVALSGAGLAEILDPGGTVRVSSDPERIGRRMDLGPKPGRRGQGLVRRRRHRRCAQPGRSGADPVHQRRRAGRRVGQRAVPVGVGTAQRRRRAAAGLPRTGRGVGTADLVAVVATDQTAHPRAGDRRDRRPGRASGSIAAQHPRGCGRGEQRGRHHTAQRQRSGAARSERRMPSVAASTVSASNPRWSTFCCPARTAATS